jgi:hypothetical protein
VNGGVIVFDTASAARGNACGTITAVNVGTKQITVTGTAAMAAGAGTALVAIPANEYRVVSNQLRWNGVALADGIEDFQVGYVFDFDGDNVIDTAPDELRGWTTSGTGSTAYLSSAFPPNQMRELRIGIVSRSRMTDATYVGGRPQALLNRTAITRPTFRRRPTGRVLLRNLATRINS